ncbi:MAG: glycine--tRNA ligase subunit beta [Myxococcota bacterium]|nr:glycine--tRNA ligase subunit beta [Myxococcota bacterium]
MAELLIECLCEELPYGMIEPALKALDKGLRELLKGVSIGASRCYSTPRRLCVVIQDVAEGRPLTEELVTGPPLAAAKRDGQWTRAAEGFAKGKGLTVDDLQVVESKGREVIAAMVKGGGERSVELVAAGLDKLVMGLPFKKSMRWGVGEFRWGRPLHAVCAIYDGQRIETTVAGKPTTDQVVGHRRSTLGSFTATTEASYLSGLRERWVEPDRDRRQATIRQQLNDLAGTQSVTVSWDPRLLEEVTDLVEWPTPVAANFDDKLLELPSRLLVESMRVHQRYFPTTRDGALTSTFLLVSNNPTGDAQIIAEGNRRVLAARFHDASFFLAEDRKLSLQEHAAGLEKMRWVRKLGTMADKQLRITQLAAQISALFGADEDTVAAAGAVCKADLLSQMVGEFPELQGHMGRLYAEHQGMPESQAVAIEEHYLPRYSGDALPETPAGRALAVADRLDTLLGCFSIGLIPKGSADPQGLRRAAIGTNAILAAAGPQDLSWKALLELASAGRDIDAETLGKLQGFMQARFRAALIAEGYGTDLVDAVLAAEGVEPGPAQVLARAKALKALSEGGEFGTLLQALRRPLNIAKDHSGSALHLGAYALPVEQSLAEAAQALSEAVSQDSPAELLARMVALKPQIDAYFDEVMVMADDPAVRAQRLDLMRFIAGVFLTLADFRLISTE